jgi:hypothetical protein
MQGSGLTMRSRNCLGVHVRGLHPQEPALRPPEGSTAFALGSFRLEWASWSGNVPDQHAGDSGGISALLPTNPCRGANHYGATIYPQPAVYNGPGRGCSMRE